LTNALRPEEHPKTHDAVGRRTAVAAADIAHFREEPYGVPSRGSSSAARTGIENLAFRPP